MKNKISVMIVDDHRLVAEAWAEIINDNPEFYVSEICDNTETAIHSIELSKPNLVILDVSISPISGIEATKIIRKISPATKIIGVSMHTQPSYANKMLKNGALAYVTKNSHQKEMWEAIHAVIAGKKYICKEIKDNLALETFFDDPNANISKLTEREIDILKLISDGLSSKEISEKLFLSVRTIEVHRYHILKKLQQKNTPSLLKFLSTTSLNF